MGRLEDKLGAENNSSKQFVPTEEEEQIEEEEVYHREKPTILPKRLKKFGFSKNANALATEIENNPTPKGYLQKVFYGRPIDIHMLEDFLVWRVSPLEIKTILRYGHAKTIEDLRAYLTGAERARGGAGKWIMLIIIAIICMVGGIIFIMFGPKLLSGFMGGGGGTT